MKLLLLSCAVLSVHAKDRGMCGMQCNNTKTPPGPHAVPGGWPTAPCSGDCGTCVCSDPDWYPDRPPTVCSCVNTAASPPDTPKADWSYTVWPKQFTCQEETRTWTDFDGKMAIAKGKFYYDDVNGHSRSDWHPYTTGQNATQVWIAGEKNSLYYVKSGPMCMYFHIKDFGQNNTPVQLEHRDYMKKCNEAGFAHYVGRVKADGGDGGMEWADHYSCHVHYPAADPKNPKSNFTVTFQNFNSLGLGPALSKTKLGYPIRITAGNADPIQSLGTPRLTTIWYSDFDENGLKPGDFDKPKGNCTPVGQEEAEAHFGHGLHRGLRHDPSFHHRAHQLLTRIPQKADLVRAKALRPHRRYTGATRAAIRSVLNKHLQATSSLRTLPCEDSTLDSIYKTQRQIFNMRSHRIQAEYTKNDKRRMPFNSLEELERNQKIEKELLLGRPDLIPIVRDARCHEAVMWYTHHLTQHAKEDLAYAGAVIPLLPKGDQIRPAEADSDAILDKVHKEYEATLSAAVCHTETGIPSPPISDVVV